MRAVDAGMVYVLDGATRYLISMNEGRIDAALSPSEPLGAYVAASPVWLLLAQDAALPSFHIIRPS